MKTHVLRTSILALLLAVAGNAQSSLPLNADIPFSFVAGHATLPPGHYTLNQASSGLITLKSQERKVGAFMYTAASDCPGNQSASRLIFHRYGTTYLLSQIWTKGSSCGRQAGVTSRERELAARYTAPDETIVLAIR